MIDVEHPEITSVRRWGDPAPQKRSEFDDFRATPEDDEEDDE